MMDFTSLSIKYSNFKPDGRPLIIPVSWRQFISNADADDIMFFALPMDSTRVHLCLQGQGQS
eukprot:scaffold201474_cov86-Cyclotella_meneghiniana.AAC.2